MKISIITATLQAERYLPQCIATVDQQPRSGFDVEQIVVDGGSIDGAARLARVRNLPRLGCGEGIGVPPAH